MMATTFQPGNPPAIGDPRVLFEGDYWHEAPFGRNYGIHPDGQRFLMLTSPRNIPGATEVGVVLNWFEELEASAGN